MHVQKKEITAIVAGTACTDFAGYGEHAGTAGASMQAYNAYSLDGLERQLCSSAVKSAELIWTITLTDLNGCTFSLQSTFAKEALEILAGEDGFISLGFTA